MSAFRYEIKHIKGSENYADWLSRMPIKDKIFTRKEREFADDMSNVGLYNVKEYDFASLDWRYVQRETRNDNMLCKIMRYCLDGWPDTPPVEKELLIFWNKREALSIENNCVLWGHRVVVPKNLRSLVIHELHYSHFGISKMKALARSFVWWPSIDQDLEKTTRSCIQCLETKKKPVKVPLSPWSWPTMPWHRVHADFLGPIEGKVVLLMIDSHSKWPEAFIMPNMSENATIAVFKEVFTRFGYPAHLVTDNYSTFVGEKFQKLMKNSGIRHSTSPTYYPATNGAAENLVDTFKRKIKCMVKSGLCLSEAVKQFLFDYRSTPHTSTNQSPAKLMLGRELRTRFSLIRPRETECLMYNNQNRQMDNHKGARQVKFNVGDSVMVTDHRSGKMKWITAKILKILVPGVTYLVEIDSATIMKRHSNQMLECSEEVCEEPTSVSKNKVDDSQTVLRRSERLKNTADK